MDTRDSARPETPKPGITGYRELSRAELDHAYGAILDAMRFVAAAPHPTIETAPVEEPPMHAWSSQAALDVLAERRRQIEVEGWTPEHDDSHRDQSLSVAAACYALAGVQGARPGALSPHYLASFTGWGSGWFKPTDPRRNLIKAAALLLAEIERLDRAGAAPGAA